MTQYCRYCFHCIVGDMAYCTAKQKTMSDATAKSTNNCKDFNFFEMDAFGEAKVDEYYVHDERIYFRDDEDYDQLLDNIDGWETWDDVQLEEAYAALPWIKAIIINIDLP